MSCGIGPVVLTILYAILHRSGELDVLSVDRVCVGILSITALAFVAGGNSVYRAFVSASVALNAIVKNLESHNFAS